MLHKKEKLFEIALEYLETNVSPELKEDFEHLTITVGTPLVESADPRTVVAELNGKSIILNDYTTNVQDFNAAAYGGLWGGGAPSLKVFLKFKGVRAYNVVKYFEQTNYMYGRDTHGTRIKEDLVREFVSQFKLSLSKYNDTFKKYRESILRLGSTTLENSYHNILIFDSTHAGKIALQTSGTYLEYSFEYTNMFSAEHKILHGRQYQPFINAFKSFSHQNYLDFNVVLMLLNDFECKPMFTDVKKVPTEGYIKYMYNNYTTKIYVKTDEADEYFNPSMLCDFDTTYTTTSYRRNGFKVSGRLVNEIGQLYFHECEECGFQSRNNNTLSEIAAQIKEDWNFEVDALEVYRLVNAVTQELYESDEQEYYECYSCGMGTMRDEDDDYHNSRHISDEQYKKVFEINGVEKHRDHLLEFEEDEEYNSNSYRYFGVNNYNFQPDFVFGDKEIESVEDADPSNKLYLGVEIEMDHAGTCSDRSRLISSAMTKNKPLVYAMSDGSLDDGIEIATMPLTLKAHKEMMHYKKAFKTAVALGYRAHDTSSCGIHVHMDRDFFGGNKKTSLYKASLLALVMERLWEDFVKFSRRKYNRLDQWAKKKDFSDNITHDSSEADLRDEFVDKYDRDRYVAFNITNAKTYELRIFRGTLKYKSFMATLEFVHNLAYWVKDHTLTDAQQVDFKTIVEYIDQDYLMNYCEERGMFTETSPEVPASETPILDNITSSDGIGFGTVSTESIVTQWDAVAGVENLRSFEELYSGADVQASINAFDLFIRGEDERVAEAQEFIDRAEELLTPIEDERGDD